MSGAADPREAFIEAATWHGALQRAEAILAAHAGLAGADIHTAAITGDDAAVRRFLALDPKSATAKSGPYGGDALTYLGLSKYLRLDPARSDAFLRAATALLDAGADPNTGFWTTGPHPEFETALYGAAADPNRRRSRGGAPSIMPWPATTASPSSAKVDEVLGRYRK